VEKCTLRTPKVYKKARPERSPCCHDAVKVGARRSKHRETLGKRARDTPPKCGTFGGAGGGRLARHYAGRLGSWKRTGNGPERARNDAPG